MNRSVLVTMLVLFLWTIPDLPAAADMLEREQHKRECMENLRAIGEAIEAYKADHQGQVPDWLSDLYPEYLQDAQVLLCPADEAKGVPAAFTAYRDPKMPCSYLYEFNPMKFLYSALFDTKLPEEQTYKEVKTAQLTYYGSMVPIARCHHHGAKVLDLGYDGRTYLPSGDWERGTEAMAMLLSFFQSAIESDPDGWEKEFSLEAIHNHFNNADRLPELRALLEKQASPSVDALRVLGDIYHSEGRTHKAIEVCHQLLRLDSGHIDTRVRLARLYAEAGNYEAAREQCKQIAQTESGRAKVHSLLAELDAVAEGDRLRETAKGSEMHYLVKLQEALLSAPEELRSTVRNALSIMDTSFGEPASVMRLKYLYRTLDESLSARQGQWRTYTTSEGLTNDFIYSIAQDHRGILWMGTMEGVCQYDGRTFTPFTANEVLSKEIILSILIDSHGNLWFGTRSHGIVRYDGESFVNYTVKDGLAGHSVTEIFQDRNGFLWFACGAGGVSRYDGKNFASFTTEDGLAHNQVRTLTEDSQGILWVATRDGVSKYDGKTFTSLTEADGLIGNDIWAIAEDRSGHLWFGAGNGVSRYDRESFTSYTTKDGLIGNDVRDILEDRQGNIWFNVLGRGISCYDGEKFINFTRQDGLAGNSINCLFEDREGNIWFGHREANGLSRLNPHGLRNYGIQDGLPGNVIHAITQDSEGNLWVAADGEVCMYNGSIFTQPIAQSQRTLGYVSAILADTKGSIWFGTGDRGLIRYDGKNYRRFTTLDGMVGNRINLSPAMLETNNGSIWICLLGSGISQYDGSGFSNLTVAHGLASSRVTCLTEDDHGNLWIGTDGGGIVRYDGTNFANFTSDDGLASDFVISAFTDAQGQIWVSTLAGLNRYDGTSFTMPPQFAGKMVIDMIEDQDGYTWLGTANNGVIKTDGDVLMHITTGDGLSSSRVYALEEDRNGDIWIGTHEGLARYTANSVAPLIHIDSLIADKVYTQPEYVSLPPAARNLEVNYSGISFRTRPEAMQFLYQLEGYDNDWRGPTSEHSVDYLGLKPGEYTFKVKAVDMDLNYSETASASITIQTLSFYRTGAFLIGLIVSGGASLLIAILLAIHRLRASRAEKLRLRRELEDAHQTQLRLLPRTAPSVDGFDIDGFSSPAREVGGDFFDYLSLADGRTCIALADVSDKGLKAAMNAVLTNGMLHEAAAIEPSCGKILSRLNADLYPRMEKQMFAALELAILDEENGRLQWANAAQPYPILKRDGQVLDLKSDGGLPLGMVPDVAYADYESELEAGDIVIFYTDGIIEAENGAGEMYGAERLEQVMAHIDPAMNAGEIIKAIQQDITGFAETAKQYDDMTIVVVKKLQI